MVQLHLANPPEWVFLTIRSMVEAKSAKSALTYNPLKVAHWSDALQAGRQTSNCWLQSIETVLEMLPDGIEQLDKFTRGQSYFYKNVKMNFNSRSQLKPLKGDKWVLILFKQIQQQVPHSTHLNLVRQLQNCWTLWSYLQCCRAETICFGSSSGSEFQNVSALAPEPSPTLALYVSVCTALKFKKLIIHYF